MIEIEDAAWARLLTAIAIESNGHRNDPVPYAEQVKCICEAVAVRLEAEASETCALEFDDQMQSLILGLVIGNYLSWRLGLKIVEVPERVKQ